MSRAEREAPHARPRIAIACGGTGGHLFPGLAVAEALEARGSDILLLVSPKEVDRQALRAVAEDKVATLPAVALERGGWSRFVRAAWQSLVLCRALFQRDPPAAVLAMGGFTSAPPVLAGWHLGAPTFLHEGNAVAGRANRWLARVVDRAFLHFPDAANQLRPRRTAVTGMPVRSGFGEGDAAPARLALGLQPQRPVLLVVGGSQGAHAINEAVCRLLPALTLVEPELQFIHLTGSEDVDLVRRAYAAQACRAVVRPFLTEMELALRAASVAISRAGASALAEFAAVRLPALLIPFPAAANNHQFHNARLFAAAGAARLLPQTEATPERLLWQVRDLLRTDSTRQAMSAALARWHRPDAAERIAEAIWLRLRKRPSVAAVSPDALGPSTGLIPLKPADSPPPP